MNKDKLQTGYERLKACFSSDTCEQMDCAYFIRPDELAEVLEILEKVIEKNEPSHTLRE